MHRLLKYLKSKESFKKAWEDCEQLEWLFSIASILEIDESIILETRIYCSKVLSITNIRYFLENSLSKLSKPEYNNIEDLREIAENAEYRYLNLTLEYTEAEQKKFNLYRLCICRHLLTSQVFQKNAEAKILQYIIEN
jgi:hypothetical protein